VKRDAPGDGFPDGFEFQPRRRGRLIFLPPEVLADVRAGIEFAEASPLPDPSVLLDDVYA